MNKSPLITPCVLSKCISGNWRRFVLRCIVVIGNLYYYDTDNREFIEVPLKGRSGIYVIINTYNNKKYVGQSVDLFTRKKKHFYDLRNKKHQNTHLQNACNLYGVGNFVFAVLEYVSNNSELLEREQYWIDELQPEYNIVLDVLHYVPNCIKNDEFDFFEIRKELDMFIRPLWHARVYAGRNGDYRWDITQTNPA